jgi:hypothetical protein
MQVSAMTTVAATVSGEDNNGFRVDLDSHADTCCVGNGALIVNQTERTVRVTPFLQSLGSVDKVPVVTAAIAYDDPTTGEVFVLVIHQALHFPEMKNCLLSPMQLRLNDIEINERPKFLTDKPTTKDHAIVATDLTIPLDLHGITSYFPARRPTTDKYKTSDRIELTYPHPNWSPHSEQFAEEEAKRNEIDGLSSWNHRCISVVHDEESFERDLSYVFRISALTSDNPRFHMSPEVLSKNWGLMQQHKKR